MENQLPIYWKDQTHLIETYIQHSVHISTSFDNEVQWPLRPTITFLA